MAAPDESFDLPSTGDLASEQPLTTGKMLKIRSALSHLEQWLGDSFTAAKDHDHDGVNSKTVKGSLKSGGESYSSSGTTTSTSITANTVSSVTVPANGKLFVFVRADLIAIKDLGAGPTVDSIDIKFNGSSIRNITTDSVSALGSSIQVDGFSFLGFYSNTQSPEADVTGDITFAINGTVPSGDFIGYENSHLTYQVFN